MRQLSSTHIDQLLQILNGGSTGSTQPFNLTIAMRVEVRRPSGGYESVVKEGIQFLRHKRDSKSFGHFTHAIAMDQLQFNEEWSQWKRVHNKQYADQLEHDRRQNQWTQNVVEIMQHNAQYDLGLVTYEMGVNEYSDLSWDEFRDRYVTGFVQDVLTGTNQNESTTFNVSEVNQAVPDNIDWRTKGLVRQVKNQGSCGSCWAFSTTGAIEGQYAKKYGRQMEFSEQQLVDCSTSYGNHGCHGGLMENAYRYLEKFGLEPENAYPYHARVSEMDSVNELTIMMGCSWCGRECDRIFLILYSVVVILSSKEKR
ncbi:unnamed protein product [Echinostoma caproni]|uniref:Pept_C1 domain-containing protein n=1 Tax=Echinostoma caproni TaxID=27848 RepID=A0A183AFX0_9TREM|nr:unnamed protein product [Echinostoma caproni]